MNQKGTSCLFGVSACRSELVPVIQATWKLLILKRIAMWHGTCTSAGMDIQKSRPVPGIPVVSIASGRDRAYAPRHAPAAGHSSPQGIPRPVVGPHSPLSSSSLPGASRIALPLIYRLKVVEPGSWRIVSTTRMTGPQEAMAALRLLGPTSMQPVLVSDSMIQFFPRSV
jgi:hypothetical protein